LSLAAHGVRLDGVKKRITTLLVLFVVLLGGELAREWGLYTYRTRTLQKAYWTIDKQMRGESALTKKDTQKMLGPPDKTGPLEDGGEMWSWSSRSYQGRLWRLIGKGPTMNPYDLDVAFDREGRAVNVFSNAN
jgi:hypothetical protein